jgi:tetratricopeptide (TPR) repeat protein
VWAGQQRVPFGGDLYERGLAQFSANLGALLSRYRDAGIPVFIGTIASNERDQRPLAAADGPDPDSSLAFFRRGRALEAAGDSAGARAAYREAKERDPLRFRAPEAINHFIREEASEHGAIVVESQRALERASPGAVVGSTLMLEHLHPNLDGYRLIAEAFHEALRASQMLAANDRAVAESIRPPSAGTRPSAESTRTASRDLPPIPITPLDSLIGQLRTDRLLSSWPFVSRNAERVPAVDTMQPRTETERLAKAVVLGQLPWPEATERLRDAAVRAGDWETALASASALAVEYSWSPEPFLEASQAAVQLQRWPEALHWARQSVERRASPGTVQLVGLLMLRLGDHAGAMPWLQRASAMSPADRRMTVVLQAAGMLPGLERRVAEVPRDTTALQELAAGYAITQQPEKARETAERLLRIAPAHAGAKQLLSRLSRSGKAP